MFYKRQTLTGKKSFVLEKVLHSSSAHRQTDQKGSAARHAKIGERRRTAKYVAARRASATKQTGLFHQSGRSGVLVLSKPLGWQLSSQALLSRKLVHSRSCGGKLKSQPQMIEHASDIGVFIPAFDFAGNYF